MSNSVISKMNVLGLAQKGLEDFLLQLGEKPFRAQQILKWLHMHGLTNFDGMTDLSKSLREKLHTHADINLPKIIFDHTAIDGTRKWLLQLGDGNCIEMVFIPEKNRGTLCISSQVGCVLNCDFCSTGKQGFSRNLFAHEIISQLFIAARTLSKAQGALDHTITNVVFMGMGEPLLNLENLLVAIDIMLSDFAYGLSKRRVTVSTAGIVPMIYQLREQTDVALAVSLHAPNDTLRNELVPINKKYPLEDLITACRAYFSADRRRYVTMEYVMLDGINDSPSHAKQLLKLLSGLRAKINLIPFNPFPNTSYQRSKPAVIAEFRDRLLKGGFNTTIRRTRGDEIDAACGQLVGQVKDKTRRKERLLHKQQMAQKMNHQEKRTDNVA